MLYGRYRAHVVQNEDPEMRGRIMVVCPKLFPSQPTSIPTTGKWSDVPFDFPKVGWCEPAMGYGSFFIPPVDAGVWLEFEGGDPAWPLWTGIWFTGASGARPPIASGQTLNPDGSTTEPLRRIVYSTKHQIVLDDDPNSSTFGITLLTDGGNELYLSDTDGSLKLQSYTGATIKVDASGKLSTNANVEDAFDFFVLKKFVTQYMDTHTHTGNLGAPTSPPILTSSTFAGVGLATDKV